MPFQKGHPGSNNGGGRPPKELCMSDLLRAVVKQTDPKKKRAKLQIVVDTIVSKAMEGEQWACEMMFQRLEGKVKDTLQLEDNRPQVTILTNVPTPGIFRLPEPARGALPPASDQPNEEN